MYIKLKLKPSVDSCFNGSEHQCERCGNIRKIYSYEMEWDDNKDFIFTPLWLCEECATQIIEEHKDEN